MFPSAPCSSADYTSSGRELVPRKGLMRSTEGEFPLTICTFWCVPSCNGMPLSTSPRPMRNPQVESKPVPDQQRRKEKPPKQSAVVGGSQSFLGSGALGTKHGGKSRPLVSILTAVWNLQVCKDFRLHSENSEAIGLQRCLFPIWTLPGAQGGQQRKLQCAVSICGGLCLRESGCQLSLPRMDIHHLNWSVFLPVLLFY